MFRSLTLPAGVKGRVYLHSMPGRYEKFEDTTSAIKDLKIDGVICLATEEEIRLKSPIYMKMIQANEHDWRQRMFPILNFGVPSDWDEFFQLSKDLSQHLLSGNNFLIHCGGGIGRTGTLAVGVLLFLGMEIEEAKEVATSAGSFPETTSQDQLLEWLELKLT